ncbi:MAG: DUF1634 domain-containing protein [Omnitrophica WOR_2 bacterium]
MKKKRPDYENRTRTIMSNILRTGIILSALIVITGGILYFTQHAAEPFNYKTFSGEPDRLKHISSILHEAIHLRSRPIIQTGLLILIATPVLRVIFSFINFIFEKDFFYAFISFIVTLILFYSLFLYN